ncbi:MAG TPA: carboxypeptidase-like regulatory domain-containing protein, partial [Sediminibacterium sp.]|nr:carboxypeptidase-like regulatory domain-containing protein [Sediminibacterium sp.]
LYEIGPNTGKDIGKATITGYIRDRLTGETISGATISIDTPQVVAHTDPFGYYSITLPRGYHRVKISSLGKQTQQLQVALHANGKLDIAMDDYVENLKEVIVRNREVTANVTNTQMGVTKLTATTIKRVPVVFGEADILRVVLTLPGVTSVGEASSGYNVRGGSADQNMILFNDATIYNPTHLFGFFSAFDADLVKNVELYKSAIPEKYGGRLSSVLDIDMRDGNTNKWTGTAGLGPLTSKFNIEGPIKKNKTSILFGGRTTYSDWLLHSLTNAAYSNSGASFYDLNLHITHTIDNKNALYFTGYLSRDLFNLNYDTAYRYGNTSANIKWRHLFNERWSGVFTAGLDQYQYSVTSTYVPVNGYQLRYDIQQKNLRADFTYRVNNNHTLNFGATTTYYTLHPGSFEPYGDQSLVKPNTVQKEQALESALYIGDAYTVTAKFSVNAGLHFSLFNYLGPHESYQYLSGTPRTVNTISDTIQYGSGRFVKTYGAPEIRISARYQLGANTSVKLSYNTMRQYIHMLSNTTAISPTDIWKLSDNYIPPQNGQQVSVGLFRNFKKNTIETSIEVYYKTIRHYLDYKSGASLILNHHIETDVVNADGEAYGVEFLLKKTAGKFTGWFSYAYSRALLKTNDPLATQPVNGGQYYPADYDKPHTVNVIANYQFSHRLSVSSNLVYSSGRPITLPLATFNIGGATSLYYSQRNEYRIPDYFRMDFSVNLEGNHKVKQRFHNAWSAGVYNLTARQNAYSVYFTNENGQVKGYQLSIFGTIIPFITYHIKF